MSTTRKTPRQRAERIQAMRAEFERLPAGTRRDGVGARLDIYETREAIRLLGDGTLSLYEAITIADADRWTHLEGT